MAARAELVETVIRPALEQGRDVVCDRFVTSTYVYQGRAGGLDRVSIRHAALAACGDVIPDWTGVLDVPFEVSLKRRESTADRIEARSKEYFDRVRSGFLEEAKLDPERFSVIDCGRSADEAFELVVREVSRVVDADRS
jgi:dTMP kinase